MQTPASFSLKVIHLNEVDSTNNYATRLISSQTVEEGTVILSFRQTNGRGHGKNVWESAENMNLTFSMLFSPDFLRASRQFLLSQAVSLGISDFLKTKTGNVFIKWPNDILAGRKKIAGILIEHTVMKDLLHSSVVGIGLNVNQHIFPARLPHATSLARECGREFQLMEILEEVVREIMTWYQYLKEGRDQLIRQRYLEQLYGFGEYVSYREGSRVFDAAIRGIDEYGQLLLEEKNGAVTAWPFKSLEMIL